jgi:parallel beta-helix repeat protein
MTKRTHLAAALLAGLCAAGDALGQSCGETLTGAVTLSADLACPAGHGLVLASGAALDCAGHSISGGSQLGQYGVYVRDAIGAAVRNCVVERFEVGIRLRAASDTLVADSVSRESLRYGLEVTQGTVRAQVLRNQVLASGDEGIHVSGPEDADADNDISDNLVDGSGLEGIYLIGSDANTLRGNTLQNQGTAGIRLKESDRNLIADNLLAGDPLELAEGSRENVLVGNTVVGDRVRFVGASANLLSATSVRVEDGRPTNAYEFRQGAVNNTVANSEGEGNVVQHVAASGASTGNAFVHFAAEPPLRCAIEPGSSVAVTDPDGNRLACGGSPGDERLAGTRLALAAPLSAPTRRSFALVVRDPALTLGRGALTDDDPTRAGAHLRLAWNGGEATHDLPAAGWRYVGAPGFLRGYRYRDPSRASGPIGAVILVGGRLLTVRGRGDGLALPLEGDPSPVAVSLTLGADGTRYCVAFGGTVSVVPRRAFRARHAEAPRTCAP